MTASYNDPVVAVDELGREIRMTRTGQRYLATDLAPTRPQATAGRGLGYNILDNIIGYDDGVDTPGERAGAAIGAIASDPIGAARGAATGIGGLIERLVGGTGTMGDVVDATGLLNLGSVVGTAPRGALRSGPMRVYHGGPEQITSPRATIDPEGLPEGFSVARTPDIARVYANMRGNNGGVISEFEINPDQLRTIGEMDYYNFLDDLEMRMGVDREDLTDAEIRNALLDEGYNAIWYPDEDFGIRILDPSILRPVSQTPAQSGVGLLSPSFDEYLARVNPQGSRIPAEARPNLMMGDMYGMLPDNAKRVGGRDGVQFYEADGDFYATAYNPDVGEMDVVGYAMNRGDMTDLQVVGEMQGSGIGSELQYLYRRANPDALSGGLTEAGERSLRRTYDRLAREGLIPQSQPQTTDPLRNLRGLLAR